MAASTEGEILEGLARIREVIDSQLPFLEQTPRQLDLASLQRFGDDLPASLDADETDRLLGEISRLSPWLQGPFYLGGEVVIEGLWRNDTRWEAMRPHLPDVAGKRVLDVGSNAGYDPFMFHVLGASEVLGCEPFEFIAQARFLESVYRTGVQLERIGWQQLDPEVHGRFDFVHCNGVLYHEPNPIELIQRLRAMVGVDGELWLGSMMLADAELSEFFRFVPNDYAGDRTWWWVPGRLALRWMMEAAGFAADALPIVFGGPSGDFDVINGYVRGRPIEPDPLLAGARVLRDSDTD